MTFKVDVPGLNSLPLMLDRLGKDSQNGAKYASDNASLEYGEGLLNAAKGDHEEVIRQITGFLENIDRYTAGQTGSAVRAAISYYLATDMASAGRVDAKYRGADVNRWEFARYYRLPGQDVLFGDCAEPQSKYLPIADYNADPAYQFEPQLWDIASPASIVRDVIWEATSLLAKLGVCDRAYDPYETWIKPLSGDWASVRGCADVFGSISAALEDMADNVRWAALGLDQVWSGRAASELQAHLLLSAKKLADAAEPLAALAEPYTIASKGMFDIGKLVGSLISDLLDAAIIFIAEASLAVGTSGTVVGGVVFGAAAVYEGYKVLDAVMLLMDCLGRADSVMASYQSALRDFGLLEQGNPLPMLDQPPTLPG